MARLRRSAGVSFRGLTSWTSATMRREAHRFAALLIGIDVKVVNPCTGVPGNIVATHSRDKRPRHVDVCTPASLEDESKRRLRPGNIFLLERDLFVLSRYCGYMLTSISPPKPIWYGTVWYCSVLLSLWCTVPYHTLYVPRLLVGCGKETSSTFNNKSFLAVTSASGRLASGITQCSRNSS